MSFRNKRGNRYLFRFIFKKYEYVYPAGGASNNAIKIGVTDLEKVLNNPKWVDVTK